MSTLFTLFAITAFIIFALNQTSWFWQIPSIPRETNETLVDEKPPNMNTSAVDSEPNPPTETYVGTVQTTHIISPLTTEKSESPPPALVQPTLPALVVEGSAVGKTDTSGDMNNTSKELENSLPSPEPSSSSPSTMVALNTAQARSTTPADSVEHEVSSDGEVQPWVQTKALSIEEREILRTKKNFFYPMCDDGQCSELEMKEKLIDEEYINEIRQWPPSTEKRVVSFGLYGNIPKYVKGAIRNAELVKVYFPGWIARFYYSGDTSNATIDKLRQLGAEIIDVKDRSMLNRFEVAADETVDRYIIRDVDSRLNARDRFAVQEWIASGMPLHSTRDHTNHCYAFNGGMWGGVKGAIPDFRTKVKAALRGNDANKYMTDMIFLGSLWESVKSQVFQHDTYCCKKFPGTTAPFPTRRPLNYIHIGQVYDHEDKPRMDDIDRFIRGRPSPCKQSNPWLYGR